MTDVARPNLTTDEARALTARIVAGLADLLPLIKEAFERRADVALGYTTWPDYCDAELRGLRVPIVDRPKAVAELRSAGMSTRAIGAALGVGKSTVDRDLSSVPDGTVPERVVGLDGKERPATRPPSPIAEAVASAIEDTAARVKDMPLRPVAITAPVDPHAEGDARRDAELDAVMAETVTRFRANFASAIAKADDVWQFDVDRLVEVYAADYDRAIRPFLQEMTVWCQRVEAAHRRAHSGLRVVGGGRA